MDMKRYKVIYVIESECASKFFDSFHDALSFALDVCCGVGGAAKIYERGDNFIYTLIYEG